MEDIFSTLGSLIVFLIIVHRIKRGELHPPHGKSFEFMRGWVPKQENY